MMRSVLKQALIAVCTFFVLPLWLIYRIEAALIGADKAFYGFSQLLSLFPGFSGNYLRFAFYKLSLAEIGRDACICFGATLVHPGTRIGRGVYVGPHCNLGLCHIEDDVLLGTSVHVLSGTAQHGTDDLDTPIRDQQGSLQQVRVGAGSWVGNKSVIAADVGRQCIIGAASVVVKPIAPLSVAVGNPAKVIRTRGPQEQSA
jgi:virginiamycin A acetyltransferase